MCEDNVMLANEVQFSHTQKCKQLQSFVCKKPTHHPKMKKMWSAEWGDSIKIFPRDLFEWYLN